MIARRLRILCWGALLAQSLCTALAQAPMSLIPLKDNKAKVLDSAELLVQYKLSFKRRPTAPRFLSQYLLLKVGKKYNQFLYDSSMVPHHELPDDVGLNVEGQGLAATVILLDKRSHTRAVTVQLEDDIYRYSEPEDYPSWTITSEEVTIMGYRCQKATGAYRGRTYEAWFAVDIPLPFGPWKLGGLPGLVLKASDTKGEFVFESSALKRSSGEPIHSLHSKAQPKGRVELEKWTAHLHKNYGKVIVASGKSIVTFDSNGNEIDGSHLSFPYNPIELE